MTATGGESLSDLGEWLNEIAERLYQVRASDDPAKLSDPQHVAELENTRAWAHAQLSAVVAAVRKKARGEEHDR